VHIGAIQFSENVDVTKNPYNAPNRPRIL